MDTLVSVVHIDNMKETVEPDNVNLPEMDWELKEQATKTVTSGGNITWKSLRTGFNSYCSLSAWRGRLPCSYWIPKYSLLDFRGDMVAGLTVGLTAVPQGLAYAAVAELPLEMGLYAAFMGCFMYALLGTCKHLTLGPTAVLSLMTAASYPAGASDLDKVNYAILLSFFSGIVQLFLGFCNLGFLVNFISAPVISGFTSASAFIIVYGQLKTLFGFKYGKSSDTIIEQTWAYIRSFKEISGWDTLLGMTCLTILLLMKQMHLPTKPKWGIGKKKWNALKEIIRTIAVLRYGIIIILTTLLGYYLTISGYTGYIALTSDVKSGIPPFGPPVFTWNNRTFGDVFTSLAPGLPMIILVGALEAIAVAKTFSFQFQYRITPSQELIALGMSNLFCSFFHAYPVTGSFARSALKAQSGVRTPMACVWTGAFVLVAMGVISQAFKYIPKAALSAVIITAIMILFEFKIFKDLWLVNKQELLVMIVTFIVSFVVGVDMGILAGVGVSLLLLLYPIARPAIVAEFKETTYTSKLAATVRGKQTVCVTVTPQGALFFPSAEYVRDFFQDVVLSENQPKNKSKPVELTVKGLDGLKAQVETEQTTSIIVDGIHLTSSDYTTLRALRSIVMNCVKMKKEISFINTPQNILRIVLPKELRANALPDGLETKQQVVVSGLSEAMRMSAAAQTQLDFLEMDPDDVRDELRQTTLSAEKNDDENAQSTGNTCSSRM